LFIEGTENEGITLLKKKEMKLNTFTEMSDNIEFLYELKKQKRTTGEDLKKEQEANRKKEKLKRKNPTLTDDRVKETKFDSIADRGKGKKVGDHYEDDDEEEKAKNGDIENIKIKGQENALKKRL